MSKKDIQEVKLAKSPFRSVYDHHVEGANYDTVPANRSLTKQSMKEECDVNHIMKKYKVTGVLTHVKAMPGQFGDFTKVTDYQTACNAVMAAQERFMAVPAAIRQKFDNDPGKFIEFCEDPANGDALVKMGLATKRQDNTKDVSGASKEVSVKGSDQSLLDVTGRTDTKGGSSK